MPIDSKKSNPDHQHLPPHAMWSAVVARDAAFDGCFVFSVVTTGVYCRPSCASRPAKRENVAFHTTCADAEVAGFRACKRCKPNEASVACVEAKMISDACRRIETAEEEPSLAMLAAHASLSPFHFQRRFKAIIGITPKAYVTARRQQRVKENLRMSESVTDAIYESGFESSGRFYAGASDALGMTPKSYRDGGAGVRIRYAVTACALGALLVAASDRGVCAILLGDAAEPLVCDLGVRFPKARITEGGHEFDVLVRRIVSYVERPTASCDLPLDIQGTAFQHRVWTALREIPPGATANYAEIAHRIGKPGAARAVAQACAANHLAVVVPCHRVLRSNGELSGYRWGVARKRILLDREIKK